MEIAIMLEGQNGLNWSNWQRFARVVEDLGFAGLYRSDHFTNAEPPNQDSLELWVALTWLASHTQRIEFGPLVSPVSFRHPAMLVRMASAVDDLSGGRLTFGVGAGWQDREHQMYSFDLLGIDDRFARFEEALQIMHRLLKQADPVTFEGEYYQFHEAVLLPRPQRPGGPPILIGGKGPKRTLPLVARYADEWNGVFMKPTHYAELNTQLDTLLHQHNRPPNSVRRSLMTGLAFGRDDAEARRRLSYYGASDPAELLPRGIIFGTASAVQDQLGAFAEAGVQRIMLQWLDLDDIDGLEALAQTVL
ncbi:MAG: TIGR03560 family F420-dependent LLM class oxidoreductase [Chloroflexi bacterium]|nr:TIGR03560 family F420-dependent LLM class oxidoreductase [Chloroflexota bacterium]